MRAEITLESVSPVSWGWYNLDADPLVVRIPSIRGTVRKWYRWYLASRRCEKPDFKEIYRKESETFGTVHGEGARRSKVALGFEVIDKRHERLNGRMPFLWPLRKRDRGFYENLKFKLLVRAEDESSLLEFLKGFALNVSLGGFGYRSNRGYGSFRVMDYEVEGGTGFHLLEATKKITNAPDPSIWVNEVVSLLRELRVVPCDQLWDIQTLSNSHLLYLGGCSGWFSCLRELEKRLKIVERELRIGHRGNKLDYRVLLGSPILDPFGRRRLTWRQRRSSSVIFGLCSNTLFVRGILLPSADYPTEPDYRGRNDVLRHFGGREGLKIAFRKVLDSFSNNGFKVISIGRLIR